LAVFGRPIPNTAGTWRGQFRGDMLFSFLFGFVGVILGKSFSKIEVGINKLLAPLKNKPIQFGLIGEAFLGMLGIISPLFLFSGQTGLGTLFEHGQEYGGLFLFTIGILKMIAIKANLGTGWKGSEICPVMFASAAIGLGLSYIFPGIDTMIGIAVRWQLQPTLS